MNFKIDQLFEKGEKFKEGSFAVIWKQQKGNPEFPAQILISIPKPFPLEELTGFP